MEKRTTSIVDREYYQAAQFEWWSGRNDGPNVDDRRWHQHVKPIDLLSDLSSIGKESIVLLGFTCDEGVKRNLGRPGAAQGPQSLRQSLSALPLVYSWIKIYDAGNITCEDGNLEAAQENLGAAVHDILQTGAFPILLGGGHEITYGHYLGIREYLSTKDIDKLGIVNFDAHFDNREPIKGVATSGTGFYQIAADCEGLETPFRYLALGIQRTSNTARLFHRAEESRTKYITADVFENNTDRDLDQKIKSLRKKSDAIYITIDMDVFAAAYAPGVSAPAHNGILPAMLFTQALEQLFNSQKVISVDFAELNPLYDIDMRTSKLAAHLIAKVVDLLMIALIQKRMKS